jgi:hypothetical protein
MMIELGAALCVCVAFMFQFAPPSARLKLLGGRLGHDNGRAPRPVRVVWGDAAPHRPTTCKGEHLGTRWPAGRPKAIRLCRPAPRAR